MLCCFLKGQIFHLVTLFQNSVFKIQSMVWFNFSPNWFTNCLWVIWWHIISTGLPEHFERNYRPFVEMAALFFFPHKELAKFFILNMLLILIRSYQISLSIQLRWVAWENNWLLSGKWIQRALAYPPTPIPTPRRLEMNVLRPRALLFMETALCGVFGSQAIWKPSSLAIYVSLSFQTLARLIIFTHTFLHVVRC